MSGTADPTALFVGIDFGTTYSGISVAISPRDGIVTAPFPNSGADARTKAPTKLLYQPHGSPIWGYDVNDDAHALKLFKLGLPHPDELGNDVRNASNFRVAKVGWESIPGSAISATADYVAGLVRYGLGALEAEFRLPRALMLQLPSHIAMTVPAVSSTLVRAAMTEAVSRARRFGLTKLHTPIRFLEEQEASLLSILSRNGPGIDTDIKQGMFVTICDCGGGTVDVATYRCLSVDPPVIEACGKPETGFCGAFRLDEAFNHLLRQRLSMLNPHQLEQVLQSHQTLLHQYWELGVKRKFSYEFTPDSFRVSVEALGNSVGRNTFISFSWHEIESIFAPVVSDIIQLIQSHVGSVGAPPSSQRGLILTGGLGANRYLHARVVEQFSSIYNIAPLLKTKEEIDERLAAVSKGAVFHAVTKVTRQPGNLRVVTVTIADASYAIRYTDSMGSLKALWLAHKGESIQSQVTHFPVGRGHFSALNGKLRLSVVCTMRKNPRKLAPDDKDACYIWAPLELLDANQLSVGIASEGDSLRFGLFYGGVELSHEEHVFVTEA